jgi:homoserine O-succinyltransferase
MITGPTRPGPGTLGRAQRLHRTASTRFRDYEPTVIDIGLINNMPDPALDATEHQFRALLGDAADDIAVHLTLYTLPEVPRTDFGRHQVSRYASIDRLWDSHHDGLIVTGTEPKATDLKDEPYWESLTRVLEWAEAHTYSTILSCLAAHAAILHLDGITRRPLDDKRFGIYECVRVSDHPLVASAPAQLRMPHSRWNEIPEEALLACGYRVLTRSEIAGVDTFIKQRKSLFVFFQGHPEYEAVTLLLEYRRDVGRYLRGERDTYPPMPHGYFDDDTVQALTALHHSALEDRREERLAEFPTAMATSKVTNNWRSAARELYHGWLRYLCAEKDQTMRGMRNGTREIA